MQHHLSNLALGFYRLAHVLLGTRHGRYLTRGTRAAVTVIAKGVR